MKKILAVAAVILLMVIVGTVCYKAGGEKQIVYPSQVSLPQNGTPNPETTNTLENLSAPPGIDPISGRPKIIPTITSEPQGQEPTEYGTPPRAETPKNYPCRGKVPPGVESKVQLFYNVLYNLDESGKYYVEMKCVNSSGQTIEEVVISLFQKDGRQTVSADGIGLKGFQPGDWCPGLGGWISTELKPPVTVFAEVTYVKP